MNGMKHGKGTFFYKSGEKYTGDIYENKKTGQGINLKILLKLLLFCCIVFVCVQMCSVL